MTRAHNDTFSVAVGETDLYFAAAHFITFGHDGREPLHGHNYRVRVRAGGVLNESGYVFDFVALRQYVREVIAPLDHKVLLPDGNPRIAIREEAETDRNPVVFVDCEDDRYVFPRADVRLLPMENTTAELLAVYVAEQLVNLLGPHWGAEVRQLRVEMEEAPGQSASYVLSAPAGRREMATE